jgi:hypothetical protein
MESGQEWLAGFQDGQHAARAALLNVLKRELARRQLAIDDSDGVRVFQHRGPITLPPPEEVREPDNPFGGEDYASGWRSGQQAGLSAILRPVRSDLAVIDLYASNEGYIADADLISELLARHRAGSTVTDEDIHSFLDAHMPALPQPPGALEAPTPSTANTQPQAEAAPRRGRLRGVWSMIRRNVDRRVAITALTATLLTAGGMKLIHEPPPPTEPKETRSQIVPPNITYPAIWQSYATPVRGMLEAMHNWVVTTVAAGNQATVHATAQGIMGSSMAWDNLKHHVSLYVLQTESVFLVSDVLVALSPTMSSPKVRRSVANAAHVLAMTHGTAAYPPQLRLQLKAYIDSNVENDAVTRTIIERLINRLP